MGKIKRIAAVILGLMILLSVSMVYGALPPPGSCFGTDNGAIRGDCPTPKPGDQWVACCYDGNHCGISFDGGATCAPDDNWGSGGADDYDVMLPEEGRCISGTFNYDWDDCRALTYTCDDTLGPPACLDTAEVYNMYNGEDCCAHKFCHSYLCEDAPKRDPSFSSCPLLTPSIPCSGNTCQCDPTYTVDQYDASYKPAKDCHDLGDGYEWVYDPWDYMGGSCELFDGMSGCNSGVCLDGSNCEKLDHPGEATPCASGYMCDMGGCVFIPIVVADIIGDCPEPNDIPCLDGTTCPGGETCASGYVCQNILGTAECVLEVSVLDTCQIDPTGDGFIVWYDGYDEISEGRAGSSAMMVLVADSGENCEGVSANFIVYDSTTDDEMVSTDDDTMSATFQYNTENAMYFAVGEWTPMEIGMFYFQSVLHKDDKMRMTPASGDLDVTAMGCEMAVEDCEDECGEEWVEAGHSLTEDEDCDNVCDCVDHWLYFSTTGSDLDGVPTDLAACFEGGIEASCESVPWGECARSDVSGKYKRQRTLRACEGSGDSECCEIDSGLCPGGASLPSVYGSGIQTKACLPEEVKEFPVFTWLNMVAVCIMIAGFYLFKRRN